MLGNNPTRNHCSGLVLGLTFEIPNAGKSKVLGSLLGGPRARLKSSAAHLQGGKQQNGSLQVFDLSCALQK